MRRPRGVARKAPVQTIIDETPMSPEEIPARFGPREARSRIWPSRKLPFDPACQTAGFGQGCGMESLSQRATVLFAATVAGRT